VRGHGGGGGGRETGTTSYLLGLAEQQYTANQLRCTTVTAAGHSETHGTGDWDVHCNWNWGWGNLGLAAHLLVCSQLLLGCCMQFLLQTHCTVAGGSGQKTSLPVLVCGRFGRFGREMLSRNGGLLANERRRIAHMSGRRHSDRPGRTPPRLPNQATAGHRRPRPTQLWGPTTTSENVLLDPVARPRCAARRALACPLLSLLPFRFVPRRPIAA
jgi:hypothetical protein